MINNHKLNVLPFFGNPQNGGHSILMMNSWSERLAEHHPERSLALTELRAIILKSLKGGLSGRLGNDDALLEDITQKALLKILEKLETYRGAGKFTSWALAIAFRTAFNEIRGRDWNHVSLDSLREKQGDAIDIPSEQSAPDTETEQRDLRHFLQDVIKTDLTQRQQDVLLAALNGMPQEEIARQLETNRNNVYKLFHDGRKALKRALEARGHDKDSLLLSTSSNVYQREEGA